MLWRAHKATVLLSKTDLRFRLFFSVQTIAGDSASTCLGFSKMCEWCEDSSVVVVVNLRFGGMITEGKWG